jgi:Fic family protein
VEERWAVINDRLNGMDEQFQREYRESFEMSWVYHDSALEGVVYTFQELKTAIDPNMSVVADSGLQPVCDEIRRHRQAIEYVRELSEKKRVPINVDTIKKIYCILHPEEGDVKTVKYRKDIPQHRLYFHEYAAPDKIAYKARQVIDWLNGPEPKKLKSPIRIAARVHYDLLRVFPFPQDSGKVSRLLMNVLLMRAGHPPAIIHSTERQRYYEALKGQLPIIVSMVSESIMNALLSIEKKIEDHDATKARASSPPKGEEKPAVPSAVVAATTARDTDLESDLYLDSELEDSDSEGESDSEDEGGDD